MGCNCNAVNESRISKKEHPENNSALAMMNIVTPSPQKSFGWSDFPLLGQSLEEVLDIKDENHRATVAAMASQADPTWLHMKPSSSKKRRQKKIKFTVVEIREYAVTVGDHPFCEDGLPLTLDWKYNSQTTVMEIGDTTAWYCWSDSAPRRLSFMERKNRLKQVSGYTEAQLRSEERKRKIRLQKELSFGGSSQQEQGLHHVPVCMNLSETVATRIL